MAKIVYPGGQAGTVGEALQPRKVNIVMYQGDDFDMTVALRQRSGDPIVLRGYTARCQFRQGSQSFEGQITIAEDGLTFELFVPGSTNEQMLGKYEYDVEFTQPNGRKRTFMAGTADVRKGVTT